MNIRRCSECTLIVASLPLVIPAGKHIVNVLGTVFGKK
jgi:hypothetical protein